MSAKNGEMTQYVDVHALLTSLALIVIQTWEDALKN